jgi:hypothetical protein
MPSHHHVPLNKILCCQEMSHQEEVPIKDNKEGRERKTSRDRTIKEDGKNNENLILLGACQYKEP